MHAASLRFASTGEKSRPNCGSGPTSTWLRGAADPDACGPEREHATDVPPFTISKLGIARTGLRSRDPGLIGINVVDREIPMHVTAKKRGNSASVRIPSPVMEAAQVRQVDVREERGRIIIKPMRVPAVDLATMVAAITDENRHAEIESGDPLGNEIL